MKTLSRFVRYWRVRLAMRRRIQAWAAQHLAEQYATYVWIDSRVNEIEIAAAMGGYRSSWNVRNLI